MAAVTVDTLAGSFRDAVCGPAAKGRAEVVWADGESQILLHVGKLVVRTVADTVVVAVDTESDEYGVTPLMVRFTFGGKDDPASLVAATDADAFGHPQVAARWGGLFRDVVWAAFARLVEVQSGGKAPGGVLVRPDGLQLTAREPFSPVELAERHLSDLVDRGLRPAPRASRR